ncbi:hypothetical protein ACOSQ2_017060 [Xanthoceras sorbifolium]
MKGHARATARTRPAHRTTIPATRRSPFTTSCEVLPEEDSSRPKAQPPGGDDTTSCDLLPGDEQRIARPIAQPLVYAEAKSRDKLKTHALSGQFTEGPTTL